MGGGTVCEICGADKYATQITDPYRHPSAVVIGYFTDEFDLELIRCGGRYHLVAGNGYMDTDEGGGDAVLTFPLPPVVDPDPGCECNDPDPAEWDRYSEAAESLDEVLRFHPQTGRWLMDTFERAGSTTGSGSATGSSVGAGE